MWCILFSCLFFGLVFVQDILRVRVRGTALLEDVLEALVFRQLLVLDFVPVLRLLQAEHGAAEAEHDEHDGPEVRALREEVDAAERKREEEQRVPGLNEHVEEFWQTMHG